MSLKQFWNEHSFRESNSNWNIYYFFTNWTRNLTKIYGSYLYNTFCIITKYQNINIEYARMIVTNIHLYHTKINNKTYLRWYKCPFISVMFTFILLLSQKQLHKCAETKFLRTIDLTVCTCKMTSSHLYDERPICMDLTKLKHWASESNSHFSLHHGMNTLGNRSTGFTIASQAIFLFIWTWM